MQVKILQRTQLRGHIYKRGEYAEVSQDEYNARPSCFGHTEDEVKDTITSTPDNAEVDNTAFKPMTKAQLQAKLESLNIPYRARDNAEQLMRRLSEAVDNHPTGV